MMEWLSWHWFSFSTLVGFEWEQPKILYLWVLVPLLLLFKRWLYWHFQQKVQVAFSKGQIQQNWYIRVLRYVPTFFITASFLLLIIALARPQKSEAETEKLTEGIDIILALDISESMLGEDLSPNRLAVAKQVATDFVQARQGDRLGIVVFAGEAYSLSPLTTDYAMLKEYIESIQPDMISVVGTAIGTALGVATNRLRESDSKTKIVILISDGDNNSGNLAPLTAAHLAAYHNIKVYTILVGKEGAVKFGTDSLGKPRIFQNTIDEKTLKDIAQVCEGKFFRANDNTGLNQIFSQINQYEKSIFTEITYKSTKDFYEIYLFWAIVFYLIWLLLKSSYLSSILED